MTYLILGCGWIGEALAVALLREGHLVYATTTQKEKYQRLESAGIFAILTDFDTDLDSRIFPKEVDFVLTSVPAVKRLLVEQLETRFQRVKDLLSIIAYKKHIFLSSVGVYPDQDGFFTEDYPLDVNPSNLRIAEDYLLSLPNTHVYRLAGLFGGARIFAKYFEDKVCTTGGQLANFVHRDDVIALLILGFNQPLHAPIYNVVAPEHPLKKAVIISSAKKYGFNLPSAFTDQDSFQKLVSGDKLQTELGYHFVYKSPLEF